MSFFVVPSSELEKRSRLERRPPSSPGANDAKIKSIPADIFDLKGPFGSIERAAEWATDRLKEYPLIPLSILEIPDTAVVRELRALPVVVESVGTK